MIMAREGKVSTHICEENVQSALFSDCLLTDVRDSCVIGSIGLDNSGLQGRERYDAVGWDKHVGRTFTSVYRSSIVDFRLGRFSPQKSSR